MKSNLPQDQYEESFKRDLFSLLVLTHAISDKLKDQDRVELLEALKAVQRWPQAHSGFMKEFDQ